MSASSVNAEKQKQRDAIVLAALPHVPFDGWTSKTLSTAAAPLDATLDGLEALLGVRLGTADVRINGLRCNGAAISGRF